VNNTEGTRQNDPVTLEEGGLFNTIVLNNKWNGGWRLFNKNTGLCEIERWCI